MLEETIRKEAIGRLGLYQALRDSRINVHVVRGKVLLSGEVDAAWKAEIAAREIRLIPGVEEVLNSISIAT